jgi:hypothetical protein
MEALLSADDAAQQVEALDIPDLYFLVKDVGLSDSYELLALATPEQIQGCIDLDVWDRDQIQLEGAKPWLAAIMDAGFEKLGRVWRGLDPELCSLMLARWCRIWDHSLGEEPEDDVEGPLYATPDTFFTLKVMSEREDDVALVHNLLDDLYRADMDLARLTIMAARSEPVASLEEYSYRWRTGRMADMGYVEFYDALEVFRPLDPERVLIGEGTADQFPSKDDSQAPSNLPRPMLEQVVGRSFLARALEELRDPDEAKRVEAGLLVLVNQVLSAARVSPGDEDAIAVGTEHATATLALGLEVVSGGDLERATQALGSISLSRLHRVGYTVTLRLSRLARQLAPKAMAAGETTQTVIKACLRARPFFPRVLEAPPVDDVRPFESSADLQKVAAHLAELTFRLALAEALGVDVIALGEAPEPRAELDDYLRTALLRGLAGAPLSTASFSEDALRGAMRRVFANGMITDAAKTAAGEQLAVVLSEAGVDTGLEHLPRLVQRWLDQLQESLGGLVDGGEIDPRFVTGIRLSGAQA